MDPIKFTQELVQEIWEEHEDKARLQECAEELWKKHRGEAHIADREGRLAEYAQETLGVSPDEAKVIAALFPQMSRDRARPVDRKPDSNPMYK